jgi:endonuclease YncB( thermonuclease family)
MRYRLRITAKVTVIDATDAPDLGQYALMGDTFYPCGREAADFLKTLTLALPDGTRIQVSGVGDRAVSFYPFGDQLEKDERQRLRGTCFVDETNIGAELVRNGWALAHHSGMTPYEIMARDHKRGLWRGEFVIPELWRAGKRLPGEPPRSSPQGKALNALRELHAVVRVDLAQPGQPVVATSLRPNAGKETDGDLALLAVFPHLMSVSARSRTITDAGLKHLDHLTELEELDLDWTKVSAASVLGMIKDRKRLRRLGLSGVDFRDEHVAGLQDLTELTLLNLRSTLITDKAIPYLRRLPKLQSLNISTTRGHITNAALEALAPITTLEDLDLDRTAITDAGLVHLKDLRHLRRLQFAYTAITDAGLLHLQALTSLGHLNSRGTKVTPQGRQQLGRALPLLDLNHPEVARWYEDWRLTKINGKVEVLDAHTLRLWDGTLIDLNGGMDAPDLNQQGKIADAFYPCGEEAAAFLKLLIADRKVTYYHEGRRGNKLHGDCFVGETCLQIEMVRNGWAVSHHTGMDSWQTIACDKHRGLWRGTFVRPELWRKGQRLPGEAAN